MVILIFSLAFAIAFVVTKSYKYVGEYYSTMQFISCTALLYVLLCRSYMVWLHPTWWFVTDKVSTLIQVFVLFPTSTALFLRWRPTITIVKVGYYLLFVALFVLMEWFLVLNHEIVYQHGWNFWWSVFIDFALFALAWTHTRSWLTACPIAAGITVILVVRFHVPMTG